MKAVFVGGGSLKLIGILREAMSVPGLFEDGEINLYDLNVPRAEAMGRMLMKTPEHRGIKCKITWGTSLEKALDGADMVGVIFRAGSWLAFEQMANASLKHGFFCSDNISPQGAFLAMKGGPIILDIARKMEKLCPNAWLVNFANPTAVLSGIVNHHTKIKALGVCQGYTNHQADLTRVIMRKDEYSYDYDVDVAGINHLSFILRGTLRGKDIFPMLDKQTAAPWKAPKLNPLTGKGPLNSITNLVKIYQRLGVLVFSTEGDGNAHLIYDEAVEETLKTSIPSANAKVRMRMKDMQKTDEWFRSHIDKELPKSFWSGNLSTNRIFGKSHDDIFVRILKGISGIETIRIVTSRPNNGAVDGFKDRTILEYSQELHKSKIKPVGNLYVPDVVYGMTAALATHQTMLADAIATRDPRLLAHALLSYPVHPYSKKATKLYKELLAINEKEIAPELRRVGMYL